MFKNDRERIQFGGRVGRNETHCERYYDKGLKPLYETRNPEERKDLMKMLDEAGGKKQSNAARKEIEDLEEL